MKRLLFASLFVLFTAIGFAQPIIDIGLKGGVHYSNLNLGGDFDLSSDGITKVHWGAFGRVGFDRFYVQPEVYFSKKGGDLSYDLLDLTGGFDYKNVDVPVLLGYKLIKSSMVDFRVMAGPVFTFVTDADYPKELDPYLKDEFFNENLFGVQYGVGIDVLFLTLDARMEHSSKIYDDPDLINGKSTSFIISVGFKIL
ncbi:porin family protein [Draconibacterium sp. IB214405]|uniref:porin family protein n=1 Tax=Draconibacterium sp. IB214405 TaxID=3097352 RepID=UPI002A17A2D1|nr:porin family protein [Draconibacterium sp. IB214405]MDX8340331.1 porin family protein [Draconibacterium sp. IB214405]